MLRVFVKCYACGVEAEDTTGWYDPYYVWHPRTAQDAPYWEQTQLCPACSKWSFHRWMQWHRRPRWLHRLYAAFFGYFWLPCPRCGELFGGHEQGRGADMQTDHSGMSTCPACPGTRPPPSHRSHLDSSTDGHQ